MNQTKFEEQAFIFLEKLFSIFDESQIEIATHWDIDHLCYRVDSLKRYEELKLSFSHFAKLLIESEINGRSIATFKLSFPIIYEHWMIDVVELPAPKLGKTTKEGFEHIEVVSDLSFDELKEKYKNLNLDLNGLNKEFNQELEIKLGERNIKFHHMSLESIIRIEKNKSIFNAIADSNLLRSFKSYAPLIIGDFPLGIDTHKSDLDILMYAKDLNILESDLKSHYENHDEFEYLRSFIDGVETLIVNFKQNHISFEVFAQTQPITLQKAYRKFLAIERLMKIGGDIFKETVMGIRLDGTNSQAAIAESLNIKKEPCNELLIIQKSDMIQLKSLLANYL